MTDVGGFFLRILLLPVRIVQGLLLLGGAVEAVFGIVNAIWPSLFNAGIGRLESLAFAVGGAVVMALGYLVQRLVILINRLFGVCPTCHGMGTIRQRVGQDSVTLPCPADCNGGRIR